MLIFTVYPVTPQLCLPACHAAGTVPLPVYPKAKTCAFPLNGPVQVNGVSEVLRRVLS